MAFEGRIITVAALAKIELPDATLRFADGLVTWGGETFKPREEDWGTIGDVGEMRESLGAQRAGGTLLFLPKDEDAAGALSEPANQNSRIRFWFAEVNRTTGEVIGAPAQVADMRLDMTTQRIGKALLALDIDYVSSNERLMNFKDGNVLSHRFHIKVWPGEMGLEHAGQQLTKAWGIASPPRGSTAGSAGGVVSGGLIGAVRGKMGDV